MSKLRIAQISESEFTIQGHGVHTAYRELTAALKKRDDVEVYVNKDAPDNVDITHIHTVGTYALQHLLKAGSKKVVSAHVVPDSFVGSLIGAKLWLPYAKWYLRWFYNKADLLFAVSDETKRELTELGVTKPIEIVYNQVDTARYATTESDKAEARKKLGIKADDWVVVGAGQVQPRKCVHDFVDTARKMPDTRFIWVGGMPFGRLAAEFGDMQRMMDTAPANVIFTGIVDMGDVKQYYQASNVFWLPSKQETFGLVVIEAAAAGLPIMLRDIPDYAETFASDALLVKPGSEVETLRKLRSDKKFYAGAKKRAGFIAKRFDSKTIIEQVIELYRGLL